MSVLKDLSEGKGQRVIERTTGVSFETQKRWLLRATAMSLKENRTL